MSAPSLPAAQVEIDMLPRVEGVGDPASDRIVAWNLLSPENRQAFREALADDDVAAGARHTIAQVLADLERSA